MMQRTIKYRAQKGGVFPSITESRLMKARNSPIASNGSEDRRDRPEPGGGYVTQRNGRRLQHSASIWPRTVRPGVYGPTCWRRAGRARGGGGAWGNPAEGGGGVPELHEVSASAGA